MFVLYYIFLFERVILRITKCDTLLSHMPCLSFSTFLPFSLRKGGFFLHVRLLLASMTCHLRLRCIDYESSRAEPISAPNKATKTQPKCSGTVPAASPVNEDGVGVLGLTDVLDAFPIPPTGLHSS